MNQNTHNQFDAFIGFDWGDKKHAYSISDAPGKIETHELEHSPENLHKWLKSLADRFKGKSVALAVETNKGPTINAFVEYPWLVLFPINPATSARYRTAFVPSGAKDDRPDSMVLLEIVQLHRDRLRPFLAHDPQTHELALLVEARRDAVDRRSQTVCQLISLLKTYYPQAISWTGEDMGADLAMDFLTKWPDLISLKSARASTLKSFYYKHNVRRPELVEERVKQIQEAVALTTNELTISVAVLQLRLLVDQLRAFQKHIAVFEKRIKEVFKTHPDAFLFSELPGAGEALAPRLLVAFSGDYESPENLQKFSGVAPVREKSGSQLWTHWRWNAPIFLRQSLVEWAGQTVTKSEWAKAYYEKMKERKKGRQAILRALAFKWIRIIWVCVKNRTPYNEARYMAQLAKRKSHYAQNLKAA